LDNGNQKSQQKTFSKHLRN